MVGSLCLRPYALEPIGDAWHRGLVRATVGEDAPDAVIEAIDDLGANVGQVHEDLFQVFKRLHGHLEVVADELAGDSAGCATTSSDTPDGASSGARGPDGA